MKYLLSALVIMSTALLAAPAGAHVVQATTSLPLTDVDVNDKPGLEQALRSAVDEVLTDAIAFKPTLVALTDAQVVGQRLYVRLLIADEEGEQTLAEVTQSEDGAGGDEPGPSRPTPRTI